MPPELEAEAEGQPVLRKPVQHTEARQQSVPEVAKKVIMDGLTLTLSSIPVVGRKQVPVAGRVHLELVPPVEARTLEPQVVAPHRPVPRVVGLQRQEQAHTLVPLRAVVVAEELLLQRRHPVEAVVAEQEQRERRLELLPSRAVEVVAPTRLVVLQPEVEVVARLMVLRPEMVDAPQKS